MKEERIIKQLKVMLENVNRSIKSGHKSQYNCGHDDGFLSAVVRMLNFVEVFGNGKKMNK